MEDESEVNFELEYLNGLLGDRYDKLNNEISIKLFNQYYYSYYEIALCGMSNNMSILEKMKWIIKKMLFKNKDTNSRNLLLLHNIRIDSHRFVVQRALSLMSEVEK